MIGSIRTLRVDKGFGFITSDGPGSMEFFFHRSAVRGTSFENLRVGATVEFEEEASTKGPRARDVRVEEV